MGLKEVNNRAKSDLSKGVWPSDIRTFGYHQAVQTPPVLLIVWLTGASFNTAPKHHSLVEERVNMVENDKVLIIWVFLPSDSWVILLQNMSSCDMAGFKSFTDFSECWACNVHGSWSSCSPGIEMHLLAQARLLHTRPILKWHYSSTGILQRTRYETEGFQTGESQLEMLESTKVIKI